VLTLVIGGNALSQPELHKLHWQWTEQITPKTNRLRESWHISNGPRSLATEMSVLEFESRSTSRKNLELQNALNAATKLDGAATCENRWTGETECVFFVILIELFR
jgi:hypothetical protein